MKHTIRILVLSFSIILLSACNNAIERTDRTITLIQENVTQIVNELTEIQHIESNLQAEFESTLNSSDDLSIFNDKDTPIMQNIDRRIEHLDLLVEEQATLVELAEELTNQRENTPLPVDQLDNHILLLNDLASSLTTYIEDYRNNLETERIIYKSIANPETDYSSFFAVFDSVDVLHTTNFINLEKVLTNFEPINAQLVNFKVYIANLKENS